MTVGDETHDPTLRRRLAWLTLAALALRAVALALTAEIPCLRDECAYLTLAGALAEGRGFLSHGGHYWPPGYIAFLAASIAASGGVLAAKLAQVILSTLLVPLTFACAASAARPWGEHASRSAALLAAALIAFDPTLVAFSHYLWPETLFLPLFLAALLLVAGIGERLRAGLAAAAAPAAAAGALFGLACLIKVVPLFLVALLPVWLAVQAAVAPRPRAKAARGPLRAGLVAGLMILAAAGATIAPWTARNLLVHGRLVLIETTGGKNLVRGNNAYAPSNWDWGDHRRTPSLAAAGCAEEDLIELDRCMTRAGLRYVATHPGQFVRDAWIKLADLLNPTSFAVRHIRVGVYGDWPRPLASTVVVAIALFNAALMAGAVVGWARAPASAWRSLTALVVAYTFFVHVVTFGMSRFRLPLEPLFAIGTAMAIATRGAVASRDSRALRWGTDLSLLLLLVLWAARVDGLFHVPGPGEPPPALGVDMGRVE